MSPSLRQYRVFYKAGSSFACFGTVSSCSTFLGYLGCDSTHAAQAHVSPPTPMVWAPATGSTNSTTSTYSNTLGNFVFIIVMYISLSLKWLIPTRGMIKPPCLPCKIYWRFYPLEVSFKDLSRVISFKCLEPGNYATTCPEGYKKQHKGVRKI